MVSAIIVAPQEVMKAIAFSAKAKRLSLNLSQVTLSECSGVSYGVLKKFERTGQISLKSLLKLALVLGSLNEFNDLFAISKPEVAVSLDELINTSTRKRGRK